MIRPAKARGKPRAWRSRGGRFPTRPAAVRCREKATVYTNTPTLATDLSLEKKEKLLTRLNGYCCRSCRDLCQTLGATNCGKWLPSPTADTDLLVGGLLATPATKRIYIWLARMWGNLTSCNHEIKVADPICYLIQPL